MWNLVLGLVAVIAVLAYFVWLPREVRDVRDGHRPTPWWKTLVATSKNFQGTPQEFVAHYRRRLTLLGWVGVVAGVVLATIGLFVLLEGQSGAVSTFLLTILFGSQGIGCLSARRILDSPPPAPAPPHGGQAEGGG